MADVPSTIFLLGLSGSGKSHFLVALDVILDDQKDPDGLVHAGLAEDRAYLQPLKAAWLRGEELERTTGNAPPPPHLLMVRHPRTGVSAEFAIPDLAGESLGAHFESRSLPKDLGDGIQHAAGLMVFVHCNQKAEHDILEHPSLIREDENPTAATSPAAKDQSMASFEKGPKTTKPEGEGNPAKSANPKVDEWTIDRASMQTRVVDLLQFVAKLSPDKAPLPVAVVVSAWDLVDSVPGPLRSKIPNDPAKFVGKFWPLLNQYLANNERKFSYRVYGVSARGGGTKPEDISRLTAIERPSDRVLMVDDSNRSKDLTRPIRWILGVKAPSSA